MLWQKLLNLFFLLLPFSFALNPAEGIDLSLARVFSLIVFGFWLVNSLKSKKLLLDKRPRFWLFILFLFVVCLSYSWAPDSERAVKKILFLLPFFLLYFPVYCASLQRGSRQSLLLSIFWGTVIASAIGIMQFSLQFILGLDPTIQLLGKTVVPFFQGKSFAKLILEYPSWLVNISGATVMRAFGSFPDPHLFALYLNLVIPISLFLAFKKKKLIYILGFVLMLFASLLSFSRAAYLSLAAAAIFISATSRFKIIFHKYPLAVFLALSALLLAIFIPNPLSNRFFASFNIKEGSNSGRIEMWRKAAELTTDQPIKGVGIGNFSRVLDPSSAQRNPVYAHNLFLDFSAETGIISSLLLILALLCPIWYYFKHRRLFARMLAASFIVFIVHSLFETPFYSVHVYPLIISLLALSPNIAKHE